MLGKSIFLRVLVMFACMPCFALELAIDARKAVTVCGKPDEAAVQAYLAQKYKRKGEMMFGALIGGGECIVSLAAGAACGKKALGASLVVPAITSYLLAQKSGWLCAGNVFGFLSIPILLFIYSCVDSVSQSSKGD